MARQSNYNEEIENVWYPVAIIDAKNCDSCAL